MSTPSRIITPERRSEDVGDTVLRPQLLCDFVGQAQARANLTVFIEAARKRGEALDHVLFVGPPGLGKTTLAQIVARELGVGFRATSGPVIAKAGDLAINRGCIGGRSKVAHPAEQAAGDARGATGTPRDLIGAVLRHPDLEHAGSAGDDFF